MRNLALTLVLSLFSILLHGQELTLNESTNFYEYSHVKNSTETDVQIKFEKRLKEINLKDLNVSENSITGNGFTNHLVGGFATVEINYLVKVEFKEGRYKLTLTNFVLTDKNGSNPLEGMKSYKKKWIKIINEKLPEIIDNIESINNQDDEW